MRGRKLLALALCAALTLALALPALAAAEPDDQALLAVTAQVKETLGLDTEAFDDFQGWADEDALLGRRWSLEWSGDGARLSITADDAGKIYRYTRTDSVDDAAVNAGWYLGGRLNIPRLPEDKSDAAYDAAVAFLGRVLEPGLETAEVESAYGPSLQQSSYRFSGEVLLNGLPSPVTCSVTVRASDLAVTRFWRSDQSAGYLGGVPAATTTRSEAQARSMLRSTIDMKAQYVLEEDGKTAFVRYVPVSGDEYYVDAKSGELVNLTELYEKLWDGGGAMKYAATAEAAQDMAAGGSSNGLTQAERDGAAILAGALSKEDLDTVVKNAWPEMGLGSYTLSAAAYSVTEKELPAGQSERGAEDYNVTCRLTYSRQEGQTIRSKYVTVEAKTGQLKSLYTTRSYRGEGTENVSVNVSYADALPTAQAIMKSFAGARAGALGLADGVDARSTFGWQHLYHFQQTAGGYFYPGNYYTIGVDATDGTLSRVESYFDDEVVLQVPDKVVTKDQAIETYLAAMAVSYGYLEVPVSITTADSDLMPLLKSAGYSYVMALKNGFALAQPEGACIEGVYAESGEAVSRSTQGEDQHDLTYDDLEGHWVQAAAQALARFGIGLRGDSLEPERTLTQRDMVALLVSVEGYSYDPAAATEDDVDRLYEQAYSLGLVTPETRDEEKTVTRGELVRLILDGAGYARIAALPGIFRCDFADAAGLDGAELGYAALAQGLGLVNGGSAGAYAPDRPVTRAEAVAMLYQYMK